MYINFYPRRQSQYFLEPSSPEINRHHTIFHLKLSKKKCGSLVHRNSDLEILEKMSDFLLASKWYDATVIIDQ